MLWQDVTQFTDVVMQASVLVSLWANGNLMETLYIVPRTAAGTKHSVLWEGNTLPPNAFKANISHSWCNPGGNKLDIFGQNSLYWNRQIVFCTKQLFFLRVKIRMGGKKKYFLLVQQLCMDHPRDALIWWLQAEVHKLQNIEITSTQSKSLSNQLQTTPVK